jgi:hypothetical protein
VSTAATEVATTRRVPPFAAAAVISVAVVVFVLHCAAGALGRGYWFDEVYMPAIGRYHLDWGSADQPPLAPALAALMHTVAPAARPALAFPAALATGCAVVLAGLIAREFGCGRRAQVVTALRRRQGCGRHWPVTG